MGLLFSDGINDFFREALRTELHGKSLLMLGRQRIAMNPVQYFVVGERMGVPLENIDANETARGDIDADSFFRGLGFSEIHAMDVNDYEGADILFDLNSTTLYNDLRERFDYIVDGGTLEHIFHAGQALINIAQMVKVGGKVFHYVPASGYINHGFYSISPCLFNDFYTCNGFKLEELNISLCSKNIENNNGVPRALEDILSTGIDYRIFNCLDERFDLLHEYRGTLRCIARKEMTTVLKIPIQRHWYGFGRRGHGIIKGLKLDTYNPEEIAIWGMGRTAKKFFIMLREADYQMNRIKGFFATDTLKTTYEGYPVLDVKQFDNYGIKLILIASRLYEDEIYNDIRYLEKRGVRIIGLKQYEGFF